MTANTAWEIERKFLVTDIPIGLLEPRKIQRDKTGISDLRSQARNSAARQVW